jgi:hypothetical protein
MEPTIVVNKRKKFELMNHSKNDFFMANKKTQNFQWLARNFSKV